MVRATHPLAPASRAPRRTEMTNDPAVETAREAVIQAAKAWYAADMRNPALMQKTRDVLFEAIRDLLAAENTANRLSEGNR